MAGQAFGLAGGRRLAVTKTAANWRDKWTQWRTTWRPGSQFRPAASCRNRAAAGKWWNRRLSRTLQDPLLHVYSNLKSGVHFNEALALTLLPQGVL